MRRTASLMAALATVALVLAPALAEARPGGSSSSGSRGSRTYSAPPATTTAPNAARPMERTQAPQPAAPSTAVAGRPGAPAAAASTGSRFGTGLMAGIAGGLLGAGLFGLLSGHGLFGGMAGFMGFLGLLLQVALIGGLIFLVVRMFRRSQPQPALAGGPQGYARQMQQPQEPGRNFGGGSGIPASPPISLEEGDFRFFEQLLGEVNRAWSARDQRALEAVSTREMAQYFAQDRRDLDSRGWDNQTRDVRLEAGDLSEAWREGSVDYATVAMRISMIDVTRDRAGVVVEGDPANRQTVTELWTFRREHGDSWKLSAIQQSN